MPFANNNGVNIYYEVRGEGPPLILYHGATGNHTSWIANGFVDSLQDTYQLILMDARGHGQSDKLYEPEAYQLGHHAADVIAVLDKLGIQQVGFWGYSMGAGAGLAMARDYLNRLVALVAGGLRPYREPGATNLLLPIFEKGIEQGADVVVAGMKDVFGFMPESWEARLRSLDYRAMVALFQNLQVYGYDFRSTLPTIHIPCLFYVGEADEPEYSEMKAHVGDLPKGELLTLPGLNHAEAGSASDLLVPHVRRFLNEALR